MKLTKLKYSIPTSVTILAIFSSLAAANSFLMGERAVSFSFFVFAFILDILDGFLARRLNAVTRIGAILDSVSDFFLYLLFPALMVISIFGQTTYLLLTVGIFVACGLWRLVRFTNEGLVNKKGKDGYRGFPVFVVLPLVCVFYFNQGSLFTPSQLLVQIFLVAISLGMVSSVFVPKLQRTSAVVGIVTVLLIILIFSVIR